MSSRGLYLNINMVYTSMWTLLTDTIGARSILTAAIFPNSADVAGLECPASLESFWSGHPFYVSEQPCWYFLYDSSRCCRRYGNGRVRKQQAV